MRWVLAPWFGSATRTCWTATYLVVLGDSPLVHPTAVKALLAFVVFVGSAPTGCQPSPGQPWCPPNGVVPADSAPAGGTTARPDSLFLPPLPAPRSLRGTEAAVRVVVDSAGRPVRDSVMVCGMKDRSYAERLTAQVARASFRPAVVNGRPVRGVTWLRFGF